MSYYLPIQDFKQQLFPPSTPREYITITGQSVPILRYSQTRVKNAERGFGDFGNLEILSDKSTFGSS